MNEPIKPSPRWFQFSLRALLILMLVVAAYFAGFATSEKLAQKAIQDARDKAAAEMANAQQAALLANQRAKAAAMTFQNQATRTTYYPLIGPMPVPPLTK